ncbi:hypothetical protein RND71_009923 [Anisodus tanguticus]|uniref:Rieske domain-containing protein n=1 Tax=Anisodus tanguticus TaxID=243964 RepID=A0AAE1VHN7_9SOLA|nr:hypothetical protein RND71_009923 [Anisodus tanguticus]
MANHGAPQQPLIQPNKTETQIAVSFIFATSAALSFPFSFCCSTKTFTRKCFKGGFGVFAVYEEAGGLTNKKSSWLTIFDVEDPRSKFPQSKGMFLDANQALEVARFDIQYCDWRARQDVLTIMLLHKKVVEVMNPLAQEYKSIGTVKRELAELHESLSQDHKEASRSAEESDRPSTSSAQTPPSFFKIQSFSNMLNSSKPSPMSISPKFTNTNEYSPMSTSLANNNKVYKHYTSINDLKLVEEDCTQAMILFGSDKPLQVSYPGNNENPIDVDATFDFSNLASRQSKSTFPTQRSKRVFENQFGDNQSAKRSREESTFPVDTTTSSGTDTDLSTDYAVAVPIDCFEKPWVIFHGKDAKPGCVQNTCAHRACPLHLGSVKNDRIQCPYHGENKKNLSILHQEGMIWIWPGNDPPEATIPSLLPPSGFQIHAEIVMKLPVEHGLLLDNLLDLAHAPLTHTSTFAKGWSVPSYVGVQSCWKLLYDELERAEKMMLLKSREVEEVLM